MIFVPVICASIGFSPCKKKISKMSLQKKKLFEKDPWPHENTEVAVADYAVWPCGMPRNINF